MLCESDRPIDALARGIGPAQDPRAKSGHPDGNYVTGLPQTNRLNQIAQACELLFGSDQIPTVESRLHLGAVRHRHISVVALALRNVEYVVGDRRGARVVTCGKNGSQRPFFLSNKLGKASHLFGEGPDARACLDCLRGRVASRLLQRPDETATKLQFPRITF
jgi:hypothetical protein